MRNLLYITFIVFSSFILANENDNSHLRLYERNTSTSNVIVEYYHDESKQRIKNCSISKKSESGFLYIVFSNDNGIGIFTNSSDSSQLFCNEKNVYIKTIQSIDSSTSFKSTVHPLSNSISCDSRYTTSYYCDKTDMRECITPYTSNKIMLVSGVKTKLIDSLDKALDSDAILTLSNCIGSITKKEK